MVFILLLSFHYYKSKWHTHCTGTYLPANEGRDAGFKFK